MSRPSSLVPPIAASVGVSPLRVPAFRALLWAQGFFGVAWSVFLILPKYLAVELGASTTRIGWLMASASLINVVAAPWVARWGTRHGALSTMIAGSGVMVAGALGFVFVDAPGAWAFVFRMLQGLAWAFMFSSAAVLAMRMAPPGRTGQAIALHGSSNLVTNAIGPALAEPLLAHHGRAVTFGGAAFMALVGLWFTLRLRQRLPTFDDDGTAHAADRPGSNAGSTIARRPTRAALPAPLLGTAAVLGLAVGIMFVLYQPLALSRGYTHVSSFLVAYTIAAVSIRLLFGRLTDRLGPAPVAVWSFVAYGVVVAAMAGLGPGGLAPLGALYGLAHGAFFPAFTTLALSSVAASARTRVMAWINGAFNAGIATIGGLALVAERVGFSPVFLGAGALVTLTAAALGLWQRRPPSEN